MIKIAAILWTIAMTVGSLMPASSLGGSRFLSIPHADKVSHLIAYLGFVILWSIAFRDRTSSKSNERKVFFFAIIFGLIIEFAQLYFSQGRHFEVLDIIANIIGSLIGLVTFYKFFK